MLGLMLKEMKLKGGKRSLVALLSLLKSSKFHLTFRNIDDIDDFFKGMGL